MRLVKEKAEKPLLNKRYLIPSILAMGFVPLIMHEHTYRTHLENEDWFAVGNYTATDFFLFWKQWAIIVLALVCLLLLLIRAKYYKEKLPWDKKAVIPLIIYCVFVFLSACFAKKPLFAFAGGYDMFQSALAILSYAVLFYYTYSCIKSMDHVLYLLRVAGIGITIELLICFLQAIGHDPIATKIGKILVTNPSRWGNLDSLTLSPSIYGTIYNTDYLSMYVPVVIPIIIGLIFIEKELWRKVLNCGLLAIALFVLINGPSSAKVSAFIAFVVGVLIIGFKNKKIFIPCVVILAVGILSFCYMVSTNTGIRRKINDNWIHPYYAAEDSSVPFKKIVTGDEDDGIQMYLKDGRTLIFKFDINGDRLLINAYDGHMQSQKLNLMDDYSQVYKFSKDSKFKDMYFSIDRSSGIIRLAYIINEKTFYFLKSEGEYYLYSTAGRLEKLPQKNVGKVYEVFPNGLWSGRGPIYNRSLPILKKTLFIGVGADNYIMAYPQRNYIWDYYLGHGLNSINVKPHCYYLQLWIQEGLIAFICAIAFFNIYILKSIKLFSQNKLNGISLLGFMTFVGISAYLIDAIANDSNICTAPVFWTVVGLGCGINSLINNKVDVKNG